MAVETAIKVLKVIADYIAHARAKKLFLWLSRNKHCPLVARHIKFPTFAWASAISSATPSRLETKLRLMA